MSSEWQSRLVGSEGCPECPWGADEVDGALAGQASFVDPSGICRFAPLAKSRDWRLVAANVSVALGISMTGCATQRSDGTVVRHYFPYAIVSTPPVAPDGQRITVREVRSYGLAFGNGSTLLGHGKEHHVILPPDGRMYLVVQTDEQFQKAKELIEKHPELGLYVTKNQNP